MTSKCAALRALVDRQRQTPVALLGDHPVVHVARASRARAPARTTGASRIWRVTRHHRLAQLVHGDEPLVDQPEDEIGAAAPADRVAVRVVARRDRAALLLAGLRMIGVGDVVDVLAGQPVEAVDIDAELVDRRDDLRGRSPWRARSLLCRSRARYGRCRCLRRR